MLRKIFNLPVSRFGKSLVIIAENRLDVVKRADERPGRMGTGRPDGADVESDIILFFAGRFDRFGNIVFVVNELANAERISLERRRTGIFDFQIVNRIRRCFKRKNRIIDAV